MLQKWIGCTLLLGLLVNLSSAIYSDQAGVIDWHHRYLGTPFKVNLQPLKKAQLEPKLYVATDKNTFGEVKLDTGSIEWRLKLDCDIKAFDVQGDRAITLCTRDDREQDRLILWDIGTRHILFEWVWERRIEFLNAKGSHAYFLPSGEIFCLYSGGMLRKIAQDLSIVWTWSYQLPIGSFRRVYYSPSTDYVLGERDGKVRIMALKKESGDSEPSYELGGDVTLEKFNFDGVEFIPQRDQPTNDEYQGNCYLAWVQEGQLKLHKLGNKKESNVAILDVFDSDDGCNQDVKITSTGISWLIVQAKCSSDNQIRAKIITWDNDYNVETIYSFDPEPASTLPLFNAHYITTEKKMVVVKVSKTSKTSFDLELVDPAAEKVLHKNSFEHRFDQSGPFKKVNGYVTKADKGFKINLVAISLDGSVHMFDQSQKLWTREESLAYANQTEFLDLPDSAMWSQSVDELAEEPEKSESISALDRYLLRLQTHSQEFMNFINELQYRALSFMELFSSNSTATSSNTPFVPTSSEHLASIQLGEKVSTHRDRFGMRKFAIVLTTTRKMLALDIADKGRIVWARRMDDHDDVTPHVGSVKLFTIRKSVVKIPPILALVEQTPNKTGIVQYEGLDGTTFKDEANIPFPTIRVYQVPVEESIERRNVMLFVDHEGAIFNYPNDEHIRKDLDKFVNKFYYHTLFQKHTLTGFKVDIPDSLDETYTGSAVWQFVIPTGQELVKIVHHPNDDVASLGRVLGDRTVMYKYLNPHMFAVVTNAPVVTQDKQLDVKAEANDTSASFIPTISKCLLNIYFLDAVSGRLLHHAEHDQTRCHQESGVEVILSENRAVYTYWSDASDVKGTVAVALEFYEKPKPDERVESKEFSSFKEPVPHVIAQSYLVPFAVKALGMTNTMMGITNKNLLIASETGQLHNLPMKLFDPRRPTQIPTEAEKEELLVPYHPVIPYEPTAVISHLYELFGINSIHSSPTLLESTSLVLATGQDLFFTRVAPSGTFDMLSEEFSKSMLLATIGALVLGIVIMTPLVRRKRLRGWWL